VGVCKKYFCKSIEIKTKKKISTHFSKLWVWQFCAACGRGNMGKQLCPASLSISIAINKMLNFRKETIAKNKQEEHN